MNVAKARGKTTNEDGSAYNTSLNQPNADPGPRVVVYFNGTFVNRKNGAHARMWSLLSWLQTHLVDVSLYSYKNHPDCPWGEEEKKVFQEYFPRVKLLLEQYSFGLRLVTRIRNLLLVLFPGLGIRMIRYSVPWLAPSWGRLRGSKPTFLIVNYVDGLSELNGIGTLRTTVETHDLKFLNFAKSKNVPTASLRVLAKLRSELSAVSVADSVIAISPAEKSFFDQLSPSTKVFYVPRYIGSSISHSENNVKEFDLLFVGSSNVLNVRGLTSFLSTCPWHQHFRIGVAGEICENVQFAEFSRHFGNVSLLGFIDDLSSTYSKTVAALAPLDGTGLKIKIVDALEHGVPVFASEHAIAGLPSGFDNCVFRLDALSSPERLLDKDLMKAASQAATAYINSPSWMGDVHKLLGDLSDGSGRPAQALHVPVAGGEASGLSHHTG